ncbi:PWWP domain-containing DNA repair factor 3A-like [Paramisgurnus dabryanus]|uniref:PWWP domain-containing DNA repair factor 3A-like n=1 Tax=Paramisgurnus dabryanus TaxID=90735 RepID=UPI003CCF5889
MNTSYYVHLAQKIDHGSWTEKTGHDIVGLPRQNFGNDCGIFLLMYTLCIVTGVGFDFHEMDMPLIRQWWCRLLMERFKIEGHGQRFAFWTDEARSLVQGTLQPVYRVPRSKAVSKNVPVHIKAVSDRTTEEKRLVDFIVKLQGSEEHLLGVLNGKPSKWLHNVTSSRVPVYLDSEEQQDILFSYLRGVLDGTPTQLSFTDEVQFICNVLVPEAIIYALSVLRNLSLQEAERVFLSGPQYDYSEREEFNRKIEKQLRKEGRSFN